MVDAKNTELLIQMIELLDSACQAALAMPAQYARGRQDSVGELLADLRSVTDAVSGAQESLVGQLEHAYTAEMLENVEDTLDDIERAIGAGDEMRATMKMEYQLFPFLRQLKEAFYFWGTICPDASKMKQYYREEFAVHYQNLYLGGANHQTNLTIVVTAYNHLETTKQCVTQLLKETDFEKLGAELILIDHGSTDGTLEYFEGLGVGKVVHFKRNVRMNMFTVLSQICRSKYFALVSNDVLVCRQWAEILLNCLNSDDQIIAAVPVTPNVSNLQALAVPTDEPDEFITWASEHNRPNPALWSDRARLIPPIAMYRTAAVSQIGYADPYLYSMEFWDDDFSLRARRAGYRQLVCGDVACYHFGSVTGKEAQVQEGTLQYGRKLFLEKNGVDAYGNGFCYDDTAVQLMKQILPPQKDSALLGLDCGIGDTPLQIRNELRRHGLHCDILQLTSQEAYLPDLGPLSDEAYFVPRLIDGLAEKFEGTVFSAAYLGRDIGEYEDSDRLLQAVSSRLAAGGHFVFCCANPLFAATIHALLQFCLPENSARYCLVNPNQIRASAGKYFSHVEVLSVKKDLDGLQEFAAQYFGDAPQAAETLGIKQYYFVCRK